MMSKVLQIPLSCSVDGDAVELSHDSDRIDTIRHIWEIDLADGESVSFEVMDFVQADVPYRISARSSHEGGDWIAWPRGTEGAVSPNFDDPGKLEIEVLAIPAGTQTAAATTTASTVLRKPGRPDK